MKRWMLTAITFALLCPHVGEAGLGFGPVAALTSSAATDGAANDQHPALATDGHGHWVATWMSFPGGPLGITGNGAPVYSRSIDDGMTWSPAALVRPEAAADGNAFPTVATDGNGKWVLVWGAGAGELRATVSEDDGLTWGTPVVLASDIPALQTIASLGTDGAGTWVAAWQTDGGLGGTIGQDGDILFSRSIDDGVVWSAPAALNTDATTDFYGDSDVRLANDHAGTWVATWSSYAHTWYARSTDNGQTWSGRISLSHVGIQDSSTPDVATDGGGNWIAVWGNTNDGVGGFDDFDVWFSRSSDNGATWSTQSRLQTYMESDKGGDVRPRVVSSGDGLWSVAWISTDDLHGSIGKDFDVAISTTRDNGLTWSAPAALVTRSAGDGAAYDLIPAFVSSPSGRTLAVWASEDSLDGTLGADYDIVFAVARHDCPAAPRMDCRASNRPHGSALKIGDRVGGADQLRWTWRSSENTTPADLGDPTTSDSYAVCLYEKVGGVPGLIGEWDAAAGSSCGAVGCWSTGSGYVFYRDLKKTNGSLTRLKVRAAASGTSTVIQLSAGGPALAPPRLPLDASTPVRFQLVNLGSGVCWEGVYNEATTNDGEKFSARTD